MNFPKEEFKRILQHELRWSIGPSQTCVPRLRGNGFHAWLALGDFGGAGGCRFRLTVVGRVISARLLDFAGWIGLCGWRVGPARLQDCGQVVAGTRARCH